MIKQRIPRHIVYAVISFSCPIIMSISVAAYQSALNADFWQSQPPADTAIRAMIAFAEIAQLIVLSAAGCLIGIIFSMASLRLQQGVWSVGLAALVFNGLPFLFLILWWIKGIMVGL